MSTQTQTPEQQLIASFQSLDCYPKNRESLPFIFFQLDSVPKKESYCIDTNGNLLVYTCGHYSLTFDDASWVLNNLSWITNVRFDNWDAPSFEFPFD